ncbi:diacylglycerol kinase family protein [Novosphingobium sp. Leaf2]|uniref:diacylglycerol kinase family protein n=1 Tax=Novosphingobium sp. Leaf2 TaxID=1735670 RepID=UPI0006F7D6C5|nr:diacylglycerol kinase family protein [Novosphingobium sp. Leaf2]KQM21323.1 diacylglycerol kinase [Novosphingobium sp. Leaf2]
MKQLRHASERAIRFSLRARLKSFIFAGRGLRCLVQKEHNAWVHIVASVGAIATGLILQISVSDWRWVVLAIALVWLAEAFNTAIEDLCNRICPEFDSAIGRIKDLAAGGVLMASIAAAGIGILTFAPYLAHLF